MKLLFLTLLAFGFLMPEQALAQSGQPTRTTITVDGDFSDWSAVLTNPVQVTRDGDGSSFDCAISPDLDCPVGGGTGRDLMLFAWTYDADNIYVYAERWGSSSNILNFYFVIDIDGDQLAEASDYVLQVLWQGSNRATAKTLYYYEPFTAEGDPMVDPGTGFADGFDMAGSLGAVVAGIPGPNGGGPDGFVFEESIPWALISDEHGQLVSPGSSMFWHVCAHNNTTISEASDNLGDPSGGIGSFGFSGLRIEESWELGTASPSTIDLPHRLINEGNIDAQASLSFVSSLGFAISIYSDPDGDGDPTDGELLAVDLNGDGDYDDALEQPALASFDSNGDGRVDVALTWLESFPFVLRLEVPAGVDANTDRIDLRAELLASPEISDEAQDLLHIGYLTIFPNREGAGMVGQHIWYAHRVQNNGTVEDLAELALTHNPSPWPAALYTDPNGNGDPSDDGVLLAEDTDGDGVFENLPGDLNGDGRPELGPIAPAGGILDLVLVLQVP
ncbi:MAG: hypothetical protein JRF33_03045, partial [Deltaproteobacteria bacterium]|nr:hypothetical protein [Deltaproteobacteria bacterium]